jgi:ribosome-binding factor A
MAFSNRSFDRKQDRKLQQLCRQVQRALMYVLPGDIGDPMLRDVMVESVRPAPDAGRLLVVVTTSRPGSDLPEMLRRLELVRARLRAEVASAITRKRAPELVFQIAPQREVRP